jgi:ABC-type transport system involved in multi-copper enzyme maturation permease subunit
VVAFGWPRFQSSLKQSRREESRTEFSKICFAVKAKCFIILLSRPAMFVKSDPKSSLIFRNSVVRRILSIAKNTFREAVRDRVLYNLVLFVLLLTACAILLGDLTDGQEARTIINIGLNAMLLFGAFIAIFVGVGLVSKEIEKRTVFAVFSKPVRRSEFVIGKYLGLCLTLLVNVAVMGIGVTLALVYVGGGSMAMTIWGGIFLIFLELSILTAVAIVFSSFSSPALSALLTFFVFIIGHLSSSLRDLAAALGSKSAIYFFDFIYYLLPNLANYSFRTESANGMFPNGPMFIGGILYALVYTTILLTATILIFSRRNFK